MNIADLFIGLNIKADTQAINKITSTVSNLRQKITTVGLAFAASTFAIDRFTDDTVKATVALENIKKQTDLSVEGLQKWQQAGKLSDVNASFESIANSIAQVQKNIAGVRLGTFGAGAFSKLEIEGVKNKDAFQVLEEVREFIKDKKSAEALNLIQAIGLTPEFMNVLRLSREEFDKLGKNVFLSKDQRKDVVALGTAFTDIKLRLVALKNQAVAKLAPELTKLADGFFKWMVDNGKKIIDTFSGIARIFVVFSKTVVQMISSLSSFISYLPGINNSIKALAIGFGLLFLAMSPVLASFVLIALAIDDFVTGMKGGDSFIKDFIDAMEGLKKTFGSGALTILTAVGVALAGIAVSMGLIGKSKGLDFLKNKSKDVTKSSAGLSGKKTKLSKSSAGLSGKKTKLSKSSISGIMKHLGKIGIMRASIYGAIAYNAGKYGTLGAYKAYDKLFGEDYSVNTSLSDAKLAKERALANNVNINNNITINESVNPEATKQVIMDVANEVIMDVANKVNNNISK